VSAGKVARTLSDRGVRPACTYLIQRELNVTDSRHPDIEREALLDIAEAKLSAAARRGEWWACVFLRRYGPTKPKTVPSRNAAQEATAWVQSNFRLTLQVR